MGRTVLLGFHWVISPIMTLTYSTGQITHVRILPAARWCSSQLFTWESGEITISPFIWARTPFITWLPKVRNQTMLAFQVHWFQFQLRFCTFNGTLKVSLFLQSKLLWQMATNPFEERSKLYFWCKLLVIFLGLSSKKTQFPLKCELVYTWKLNEWLWFFLL